MVSDELYLMALNTYYENQLASTIIGFVILLVIFAIVASFLAPRSEKTKKAREMFADLYIIGTIRKFAKEDGIDLNEELKEIRRFEKIEKASMRSIDRQIEVELNEKISAKNQKKIDAINAQDLVDSN